MAAAATMFAACGEKETPSNDDWTETAPEFTSDVADIVVTEDNLAETVTFEYSAADFGVATQINYAIEVQLTEGGPTAVVATSSTTTATATLEDINYELYVRLGITVGEATDVTFYVSAQMGASEKLYSQPKTAKVTAIEAGPKKSEWGIVGSMAASGWSTNIPMFEGDEYIFALNVAINEGEEFKFRKDTDWSSGIELSYAGTAMPDAMYEGAHGGNIKMGKTGIYDIYILVETEEKGNSTGKIYIMTAGKTPDQAGEAEVVYSDPSAETFVVGLSGNVLGWDDPSFDANDRATFKSKNVTDAATFAGTYTFELASVTFAENELIKVRINGDWFGYQQVTFEGIEIAPAQSTGEGDAPLFNEDGTPKYDEGNNMVLGEAGTYKMTLSFTWDGTKASEITAAFTK